MNPVAHQPSPESILLTPLQMRIVKLEAGRAVAGVDLDALPCCTFTTVSTSLFHLVFKRNPNPERETYHHS